MYQLWVDYGDRGWVMEGFFKSMDAGNKALIAIKEAGPAFDDYVFVSVATVRG